MTLFSVPSVSPDCISVVSDPFAICFRTVGTERGDVSSIVSVYSLSCAKLNLALQHTVKTLIVMLTVLRNCTDTDFP